MAATSLMSSSPLKSNEKFEILLSVNLIYYSYVYPADEKVFFSFSLMIICFGCEEGTMTLFCIIVGTPLFVTAVAACTDLIDCKVVDFCITGVVGRIEDTAGAVFAVNVD